MFLIARFRVGDYDAWKPVFDAATDARIRHGAHGHRVFRAEQDGNALTVMIEFASRGEAEEFVGRELSRLLATGIADVDGGEHASTSQTAFLDEVDAADYRDWPYA